LTTFEGSLYFVEAGGSGAKKIIRPKIKPNQVMLVHIPWWKFTKLLKQI